jgi:hypothetical protein
MQAAALWLTQVRKSGVAASSIEAISDVGESKMLSGGGVAVAVGAGEAAGKVARLDGAEAACCVGGETRVALDG